MSESVLVLGKYMLKHLEVRARKNMKVGLNSMEHHFLYPGIPPWPIGVRLAGEGGSMLHFT